MVTDISKITLYRHEKVLIMADSQAAVLAIAAAGKSGEDRTEDLKWVIEEIEERQEQVGEEAVRFGWVKAHVGIYGNEQADRLAKQRVEEQVRGTITEGGVKQAWNEKRQASRKVVGTGMGKVLKWNRRHASTIHNAGPGWENCKYGGTS